MKKNISLVNVNASLLGWVIDKLKTAPPQAEGVSELSAALLELKDGSSSTLMLEMDEEGAASSDGLIQCGELCIYTRARKVTRDGEEISLTPKEFDILCFLARNRGEVFTKEQIYQAVWERDYLLDDSNIMAFIRKLRKKIEPDPDAPKYILTIWGIGYKFNDTL